MMEQLKHAKKMLMSCVESQLTHLDTVDAKELGEVVDMVKDLEEAMYYCTVTKAMEEGGQWTPHDKKEEGHRAHYMDYNYPTYYQEPHYRDMDRGYGRMYYTGNGSTAGGPMQGSSNGSSSMNYTEPHFTYPKMYREMEYPLDNLHDRREGRSPKARRMYMEAKEMNKDKETSMKELEKYMHELSEDVAEMIDQATAEEKQMLVKKMTELGNKIAQMK